MIQKKKVRSSEIAPDNAKSAGNDIDGVPHIITICNIYSNQLLSLVIMDTLMNHNAIKSGTFGDDLTSEWRCKKCRIYESNHIESPSYRVILHLTIFCDHLRIINQMIDSIILKLIINSFDLLPRIMRLTIVVNKQ